MFGKILLICQANICRSPVAEYLFREMVSKLGVDVQFASAGLLAQPGRAASNSMFKLMQEQGIDISAHQARSVSDSIIRWADLILVMDNNQAHTLMQKYPYSCGKIQLLGKWMNDMPIVDPYAKEKQCYQEAFKHISASVDAWCQKLWPQQTTVKSAY